MEELGKIFKSKDVSLVSKAKIIRILEFPITTYRCEGWTVKESGRRQKVIHLKYSTGRELCNTSAHRKTSCGS